jgi:hypothetical protein
MKRCLKFFHVAIALTLASVGIAGTGRVGNGADPRAIIIRKARVEAVNMTGKLQIHHEVAAAALKPKGVAKIFLESPDLIDRLSLDIHNSDHMYDLESSRPTCAWTNDPDESVVPPGLNTIRFSLPLCEPFLKSQGRSFAIHVLIHESVHHLLRDPQIKKTLGVNFSGSEQKQYEQEEQVCDQIADAIIAGFEKVAEAGISHWQDMAIPEKIESRGFHSGIWTGETGDARSSNKMLVWGGCRETESALYGCAKYFNDGSVYDPQTDSWQRMSVDNAPEGRIEHSAIWTSFGRNDSIHKFFVWGGCTDGDGCQRYLNDGGIYDIETSNWQTVNSKDAPSARSHHSVVWTGEEFLIWGGDFGVHTPGLKAVALDDGGAYNPVTKKWRKIPSSVGTISGRSFHTAIWTGETNNPDTSNRMLVWGGCDFEEFYYCKEHYGDGAFFNPATWKWEPLVTSGNSPTPRRLHGAVHIPEHNSLLIWGGERRARKLNDGAYLNLEDLTWRTMATPAPEKRSRHSLVWTGDYLIVFGGEVDLSNYAEDVGIFQFPASGSGPGKWQQVESEVMPFKVKNHSAVWSPKGMLIWGGQTDRLSFENIGAVFVPGE